MAKVQENDTATPLTRTRKRRQGQRPSPEEKQQEKERFLESFARMGNILLACRAAGVDRTTIYRWAEEDEAFSLRKNLAEQEFSDLAYAEFTRRAIQGYERPIVNNRGIVFKPDGSMLMERVVSDRLLELIIKRYRPEFREKQQVEVTARVDVTGAKELLLDRLGRLEEAKDRDA